MKRRDGVTLRHLAIASLLALLTACAGNSATGVDEATGFGAAVGTLNYSNRTGASFMFVFDLPIPPTGPIEVTIEGPTGWNVGTPVRRIYDYDDSGRRATWINVFQNGEGDLVDAVSGKYLVVASVNRKSISRELQLDVDDQLSKSSVLSVTSGTGRLNATWEPVDQAKSYLAELTNTITDEYTYSYTEGTQIAFEGIVLVTGHEYILAISALSTNFVADESARLPDGPFNTSFTSTRFSIE